MIEWNRVGRIRGVKNPCFGSHWFGRACCGQQNPGDRFPRSRIYSGQSRVLVSQKEFVEAAVETNADAIMVSSLYGHGEIDVRGLREALIEAGIGDILMYVGGYLVVGSQDWADVETKFKQLGFDRVYPPSTLPEDVIPTLKSDLGM